MATLTNGLANAYIADEPFGRRWAVGWHDSKYWVRRSDDEGKTQAAWPDAETEKEVCTASAAGSAALEFWPDGAIAVAVPTTGGSSVYVSHDFGLTWSLLT